MRKEGLLQFVEAVNRTEKWLGRLYKERRSMYTVKKVHEFPVSSRDVTNQTPPGQE